MEMEEDFMTLGFVALFIFKKNYNKYQGGSLPQRRMEPSPGTGIIFNLSNQSV